MQRYWSVIDLIVPCALLLLLVTTNVRFVAGNQFVHAKLFERHDVAARSGIATEDLNQVSRDIESYFSASGAAALIIRAPVFGRNQSLFSDAEASHMADVKNLFGKVYVVQTGMACLLFVAFALSATLRRKQFARFATIWLRRGAAISTITILVLGGISLVAFEPLFTIFHRVGFPGGNWMFDPRTDYLIKIFPFGFWRDATLLIGALTLIEASLMAVASLGLHRLTKRANS